MMNVMVVPAVFACVALAAAQTCHEDTNCFSGHFCDTLHFICRPCLRCEDLKREEPPFKNSCVKSVQECGPCLKDLVDSRRGDLTCVSRVKDAPPETDNSSKLWIFAGVVIVIFVFAVAAVVIRYLFKNTSIFKLHLDTNIDARLPTHMPTACATAPESPPPYSPAPESLRPKEDTNRPLIETYQPPFPAYESQDHQNVSMYNPPAYVRLPNSPQPEGVNDLNGNYPLRGPDEDPDTTPSAWAPGTNYTSTTTAPAVNDAGATPDPQPQEGAGDLSSALASARNTHLIQPPQVTLRLQPIISNEEADSDDEAYAHSPLDGPSARQGNGNYNVMNVQQMITIIQPPLKKPRPF